MPTNNSPINLHKMLIQIRLLAAFFYVQLQSGLEKMAWPKLTVYRSVLI